MLLSVPEKGVMGQKHVFLGHPIPELYNVNNIYMAHYCFAFICFWVFPKMFLSCHEAKLFNGKKKKQFRDTRR